MTAIFYYQMYLLPTRFPFLLHMNYPSKKSCSQYIRVQYLSYLSKSHGIEIYITRRINYFQNYTRPLLMLTLI